MINRKKCAKWLFILHGIGLLLCCLLVLFVSQKDHIRWNVGYFVVWFTFVTVIILFFIIPHGFRFRSFIKAYCGLYMSATLLCVFIIPMFPFSLSLLSEILIPHEKYYESGNYIMRCGYQEYMDLPNSMLYKRQGLFEHCVRQYDFRPVKSFIVKENVGAIIINGYILNSECTKGIETTQVLPFDDRKYQKHLGDVEKLKKTFEKDL
ncbi:MAG: hypothetical protein WCR53_06530 [Bacteroidaceae bacterium]|nr:hypothetical protein [Bacteroidaceae bacterium]